MNDIERANYEKQVIMLRLLIKQLVEIIDDLLVMIPDEPRTQIQKHRAHEIAQQILICMNMLEP